MDLRVHRNNDNCWIEKPEMINSEMRQENNPQAVSHSNVVPAAEPAPVEMEVNEPLYRGGRGNQSYSVYDFSQSSLQPRKTRTKCNCAECNPTLAGTSNSTTNVFQCHICHKYFTRCKYFRRHVGLHGKAKTLKCDFCQVSFMFSYQLQAHRLTHTHGQKPFHCNICSKSFTSKYYLKQHEWVHNPIAPFSCRFCGKGYCSEGYFKRHEMSHRL